MSSNIQAFDKIIQKTIAFYLKKNANLTISKQALVYFTLAITKYIAGLGIEIKNLGELGSRSLPNLNDVELCLNSMGHSVSELNKIAINSKKENFTLRLEAIPKKTKKAGEYQKDLFSGYNQEATQKMLNIAKERREKAGYTENNDVNRLLLKKLPQHIPEFFPQLPSSHTYKSTILKAEDELKMLLVGNFPNSESLFSKMQETIMKNSPTVGNSEKPGTLNVDSNASLPGSNGDAIKQGLPPSTESKNFTATGGSSANAMDLNLNSSAQGSESKNNAISEPSKYPSTAVSKNRDEAELNILKLRAHQKFLVQSSLENLFNKTLFPDKRLNASNYFEMMGQFTKKNGDVYHLNNKNSRELNDSITSLKRKYNNESNFENLGNTNEFANKEVWNNNKSITDTFTTQSNRVSYGLNNNRLVSNCDISSDSDMESSYKDEFIIDSSGVTKDNFYNAKGCNMEETQFFEEDKFLYSSDEYNTDQNSKNIIKKPKLTLETIESMFPPANYYNSKKYKAH
ncbi:hypothetical protein BB561_000120 [Smittium simulii]|uniref:Transcription initiation factor TFIID subunit 8 n=1 Tax=Smittium simulii TaxID=133385 RepID=A0A2T9Z0K4_9FUNG|nr:hypothetical protein BB561_000120 [Smittium simulii]